MSPTVAVDIQSDMNSDTSSDATLDDLWSPYLVGEPLTRMVRFEYWETSSDNTEFDDVEDPEPDQSAEEYLIRDEDINYITEDESPLDSRRLTGMDGQEHDAQFGINNLEYVHSVVDDIAAHPLPSPSHKFTLNSTPTHLSHPLLVRRLHSTSALSRELSLWRFLNSPGVRRDPWNPSPPALIVERELSTTSERLSRILEYGYDPEEGDNEAYIVMDRMRSLHDNPLKGPDDVIDFSRQMLQGLVFLHEHNITQASYTLDDSSGLEAIRMDIGLAPPHASFSRYDFPVKYYTLDVTKALRLRILPTAPRPSYFSRPRDRPWKELKLPVPLVLPCRAPYIRSVVEDPSIKTINACGCPNPDITLVSFSSTAPPDYAFDIETPKQSHFFPRPSSPQELSDPEDNDEASERDQEDGIQTVCAATRDRLFAVDLKNLANLLDQVVITEPAVSKVLAPVLVKMRRANATLFSAEDALRNFESAVTSFTRTKAVE